MILHFTLLQFHLRILHFSLQRRLVARSSRCEFVRLLEIPESCLKVLRRKIDATSSSESFEVCRSDGETRVAVGERFRRLLELIVMASASEFDEKQKIRTLSKAVARLLRRVAWIVSFS